METTIAVGLFALGLLALLALLLYKNNELQDDLMKARTNYLKTSDIVIRYKGYLDEANEELATLEGKLEEEHKLWILKEEKRIRADANKRSRQVLRGQATEHLAPFMQTEWATVDFNFLGKPIDYIIYDGAGAVTDGAANEIESIVLLDIKTGKAQLNKVQRRIRDCVKAGRIVFATYNPDTKELKKWENPLAAHSKQTREG